MQELDPVDLKILKLLQQDPKLSLSQLASQVYKRPQTVHDRLTRLKKEGFILRQLTLIDRRKIGLPTLAVTLVQLKQQTRETLLAFELAVVGMPQVQVCIHLSGKWDYILHVSVRDQQAYYDWLMQELFELPNIGHVKSSFALREAKVYGELSF